MKLRSSFKTDNSIHFSAGLTSYPLIVARQHRDVRRLTEHSRNPVIRGEYEPFALPSMHLFEVIKAINIISVIVYRTVEFYLNCMVERCACCFCMRKI
jgi:hypothetical protein